MPGLILHTSASLDCFHKVPCAIPPVQARVTVSGFPVALASSQIKVAPGCPFQVPVPGGTKPQPCISVAWANRSARVMVNGQALLLQAAPPPGSGPGAGMCKSAEQISQGLPTVNTMQARVLAS